LERIWNLELSTSWRNQIYCDPFAFVSKYN